ncbi:hypothetical protein TWF694_008594 [Orbilia ellipsospora]|uniref:Uncharacterized protein n=1 Tax=Orbilia ellipsospora TaxID=2528407 RepID=A0AAV9XHV4_9PEZI
MMIKDHFGEANTKPFMLPITTVEDLVATLESFLRDLRSQKAAQAERKQRLQNARMARSLNLLGKATTHAMINEHAVYALSEAYSSMAAYSEACLENSARQKLASILIMDGDDEAVTGLIDSLVEFWQRNYTP